MNRYRQSADFLRLVLLAGVLLASAAIRAQDALPSWNDGPAKAEILKFVDEVTAEGTSSFVAPSERIAVFDNDGTLWAEQPMYFQLAFALDRVRAMAKDHPEWKGKQPFDAAIKGDMKALAASGEKGIAALVAASHAGMSTDDFARTVTDWFATARHPKTRQPYSSMVYQPMLELLGYLRSKGFKTFIVSGGGVEFMRAFAEKTYGIPPEQVVGSSGVLKWEMRGNAPVLVKQPKIEFIDDGPGKPVGIQRFIGRRPVFAFGNSDGDQQMLEWTAAAGGGPRFMGLVHHTDAKREWAYDRKSSIGKLDKALDEALARKWTVVDMSTDWNRVFPFDP
ncbi:HAD family hydrolase [Niveibacterium sp. SC-1]|uniref:HAD family hydrolase n=1 Tax=Niveibacterium sp. SC-1 TaxID=3135646 RepID=UPI00312026D1